jgi:hypothetical protein
MKLCLDTINQKKQQLEKHPLLITNVIQSKNDLKTFMEYHVFAVWDFMCLAKSLQKHIAPANDIWLPSKYNRCSAAHLINDIILHEESDNNISSGYISHFDLYLQAMTEIGADTKPILSFIEHVSQYGIDSALQSNYHPKESIQFVESTFKFIKTNQPHIVASAFAFGRETVIPNMFKGILQQLNINDLEARRFHYYLERHIQIDGDEHGPASFNLVEELCENNPIKIVEAERAAINAIECRIKFWDSVETRLS